MKNWIKIEGITKVFDGVKALDNINFTVDKGEFLSILGPSGCGKTTLLRILIGIEVADDGKIFIHDEDITNLNPSKRHMGIVFQNYALFPNMTVLQNVEYALKINKETKANAREKAMEILEKVGLKDHLNKKPHEMSGGQQQRVAIARTLALNPDVILFDEPMSALDADNRLTLRREFKEIQRQFGITMIYITHDQEEAFSLSDRVMVMNKGVIEQIDTPNKIFNNPKNDYVRNFVTNHLIEKVASIESCTKVEI
ncbi:MAG: ABC transporter ATP-binding protein [Firmicutes bacterium]|nr:ABC transporter ATP-binding protein [Bacillota bacterium]